MEHNPNEPHWQAPNDQQWPPAQDQQWPPAQDQPWPPAQDQQWQPPNDQQWPPAQDPYRVSPQHQQWQPPIVDAFGPPSYGPPPVGYGLPPLYGAPPQPPRRSRRKLVAATALVGALAVGGVAVAVESSSPLAINGTGSSAQAATNSPWSWGTGSGGSSSGGSGSGGSGSGSGGGYGGGYGTGGTGTTTSAGSATATQQVGVVDITTVLKYQSAEAAGTGMILTSNGEILTNNHVVDGATSITVTVVSTGKSYAATVVGTDPTQDVAVLKLTGASGLKTINLGDSSTVTVGTSVVAVGNAGGVGGVPSAVAGTVEAVDQSITASDEGGGDAEQLTGLIMSNAPIQAGDSGGPLYDSAGKVVGIDTAGNASSSQGAATEAYSIPINTALSVAAQIELGKASTTVHIGYPAFLGIEVSSTTGTAQIAGVLSDSSAADAGLVAGDTITAIGSYPVASAADVQTAMAHYKPGQTVTVTWTDTAGASHSARVTLMTGPAD